MPYLSQKIKLKESQKRSLKLTTDQKMEIRERYANTITSYAKLAKEYNVSKRLIIFIVNPKKLEENIALRNSKGGSMQYYDKEKNTVKIREHRRYKQSLYINNELG